MMQVIERLSISPSGLGFNDLVGEFITVPSIIATFLALLELCKRQAITVEQASVFGEITISLAASATGETSILPAEELISEFDQTNSEEDRGEEGREGIEENEARGTA
jgi:chromatin segregation and condensation protein Rec8/ScpA/Scc1 (kleisin family)